MSESLTKLREATAHAIYAARSGDLPIDDLHELQRAQAAVEQEMTELREAKERVFEYVAAEWNAHAEPMFAELRDLRQYKERLLWFAANPDHLMVDRGAYNSPALFSWRRRYGGAWSEPASLGETLDAAIAATSAAPDTEQSASPGADAATAAGEG